MQNHFTCFSFFLDYDQNYKSIPLFMFDKVKNILFEKPNSRYFISEYF